MSYDPTIGRWTQEDPIAFEGGDTNLYRYVGNDPVNATDPSGLLKIVWRGDWTNAEKARIRNSLQLIANRLDPLLKEIDNELNGLSPCMRDELSPEVERLRELISDMVKGFKSNTTFEIEQFDFPKNSDAWARHRFGRGVWHPEIQFNTRVIRGKTWKSLSNDELNRLVFHELSHHYGTEDDDTKGALMNAHLIQSLVSSKFPNLIIYNGLKIDAARKCGE